MPDRFARASHIVLDTREAAEDLAVKINHSRKPCWKVFAKFAKKESLCPSAKENGGDLGWIRESRTLREFSAAVWSQDTKKVGAPVKTEQGFHLILVHERDE